MASYILFGFAIVFVLMAANDYRSSGVLGPGQRTRLLVAAIFVVVGVLVQFSLR